jgi:hypothetical protein
MASCVQVYLDQKNLLRREREAVAELLHNFVRDRIAGDDVPDDPRTLWVRKEDRLEDRLDATTK